MNVFKSMAGGRGRCPDVPIDPPKGNPVPEDLPLGFPVIPVGQSDGMFHFLTARGELMDLSASGLSSRANLVALFAGCENASDWLAWIGKPGRGDTVFNAARVSDFLVAACATLPFYDPNTSIRNVGTWRGSAGRAVAHTGGTLVYSGSDFERSGQFLDGAIYPAAPERPGPAQVAVDLAEILTMCEEIRDNWSWDRSIDADVVMGWIGQAVLGQYPRWRSHMYIEGRLGSGKSTMLRIIDGLLGGMSAGIRKGSSEAAMRQSTNRMALARIFDEAEGEGEVSKVEDLIALFRLMSDADGAVVERGTSGHKSVRFQLYGAGLLASIIPGIMRPQDRSRFVMLKLRSIPPSSAPIETANMLADIERRAVALGSMVWRRMIDEAPERWDDAHRRYSAMVQSMGGETRSGDTIGAVLAGWDLLLHDGPPTGARMERAQEIAECLLGEVTEALEEGEGERCLKTLLGSFVAKDHGGHIPIWELVERLQDEVSLDEKGPDARLLARLGLRIMPGARNMREMFVVNGEHPQLDRAFAGTRWRAGGHRSALMALDGVEPSPRPMRVAGRLVRGLVIPTMHLPAGRSHEST